MQVRFEAPLGDKAEWRHGTLYVIDSVLAFVEDGENAQGWQIEYPAITLHAISKAEGGIYCQLNDKFGLIGAEEEDGKEMMRCESSRSFRRIADHVRPLVMFTDWCLTFLSGCDFSKRCPSAPRCIPMSHRPPTMKTTRLCRCR